MENQTEPRDSKMVVPLIGRLDVVNSPDTAERLSALIEQGTRLLVLDLTALDHVSSAGLGILITVGKKIRAAGGDMVFTGVKPNIKQILTISGFTQLFKLVASPDEAFQAG